MQISLTKEKMEELFLQYLQGIFEHPEISSACVKGVDIRERHWKLPVRRRSNPAFTICTAMLIFM